MGVTKGCKLFSLVFAGALAAATIGRCAPAQNVSAQASVGDERDIQASLQSFTQVYEIVEQNYADSLNPDDVIYGPPNGAFGAIPGMLRTLDPHSNFFDPRAYAQLREQQEGRYYGVGMQIGSRPGKMGKLVTIIYQPMPGSPAFHAGLRPGDVIVQVDDKATDGLTSNQVASLLKGPKGTVVHVTILREGYQQPLEFAITRDEISQRTVDDAFMVRPGVAYIHISGFNETTNDELAEELTKLNSKSLKGLILDLRGNPGGLLQEAVEVADHFLEKNQLIVYHKGRHSPEKRWYTVKGDDGYQFPMVVLINRMTASAAEIVTGALQDHDRALVMGEPSFGKGLVQTVYPLSENTGLALTTARYYTPSGRLIQRDYTDVSLYDYYYERTGSTIPHTTVRLTDGGREVFGGGGITPDITVENPKPKGVENALEQHSAFFTFGKYYLGVHKTIPKDFVADEQVLGEFKSLLLRENIPITDSELQSNLDYIKNHIREQLVGMIYGQDKADQLAVDNDPLVQSALDHLIQAQELVAKAKRYIASQRPR